MIDVQGEVSAGFEPVREAFVANFERGDELGAAVAVHVDGRPVVDLWAGVADARADRSWDRDTLQLVFSTTKGLAAICLAMLVERGSVGLDDTVADHWPEFAAAGKGSVTVAHVMGHRAGLPAVDDPPPLEDILAVGPIVEALARQSPLWEPGTDHGYHALTYGWLVGELVRRVDGRSLGTFLREEVAGPLGADTWIGLPDAEEHRVTRLEAAPYPSDPEELELMRRVAGPGSLGGRALFLDGRFGITPGEGMTFNRPEVHASEIPAANGITTARGLSCIYGATVSDVDGVRLLRPATVDAFRSERSHGPDRCLVVESRFGAGFMLHGELSPLLGEGSFGHYGAGGSLGYADPDTGVGFGYVMNKMGGGIAGDPRPVALTAALRGCLS